jgi:hypothetical protein
MKLDFDEVVDIAGEIGIRSVPTLLVDQECSARCEVAECRKFATNPLLLCS